MCVCVHIVPLRQLRGSDLLPRGVDVAHHKVLGDLLHVLVVEEGVEAQLVCGRERGRRERWRGRQQRAGGGGGEDEDMNHAP